jgi:hypothetical protein
MPTIFVRPLDKNASMAYLAAMFEDFGRVEAIRIFVAGLKPMFAIVEMPFEESADRAIRALNGKEVDGQPVEVVELGVPKLCDPGFPTRQDDKRSVGDEDEDDRNPPPDEESG